MWGHSDHFYAISYKIIDEKKATCIEIPNHDDVRNIKHFEGEPATLLRRFSWKLPTFLTGNCNVTLSNKFNTPLDICYLALENFAQLMFKKILHHYMVL